jgi:hypothetical protein
MATCYMLLVAGFMLQLGHRHGTCKASVFSIWPFPEEDFCPQLCHIPGPTLGMGDTGISSFPRAAIQITTIAVT